MQSGRSRAHSLFYVDGMCAIVTIENEDVKI